MTAKTYLGRSITAVDNVNYFLERIPFKVTWLGFVFTPKTSYSDKRFMHESFLSFLRVVVR